MVRGSCQSLRRPPARAAGVLATLSAMALAVPAAARSLEGADLAGVRLGMTAPEVEKLLVGAQDIRRVARPTPEARRTGGRETYVQRLIARLATGRTLMVTFTSPLTGSRAVEVALIDSPPGAPAAKVLEETVSRFGPPTNRTLRNGGRDLVAGWGGRAGPQGAIEPLAGAKATLRLDVIHDNSVQLTLFDPGLSADDNRKVLDAAR